MALFGRLITIPAFILLLSSCGGGGGGGNGSDFQPPPPDEPATVQTQQVFANVDLAFATALVQAPDDASRWFAIEKSGRVVVFENDAMNATGSTFLDIRGRVESGPNEAGLLGIAFHPEFATNGEVFLSYTAPAPLTSVISRFRSFDNNQTLDPSSEEILLTIVQPASSHNGGNLAFGPGGRLYIGFGDGGGGGGDPQGNGQDTTNLHGTIVRIDVDTAGGYAIPPGNPFAGNAPCVQGFGAAACPEIHAWGFRNPWRFSFDSATGRLWAGDVGQGAWEEVDRVEAGENYGWNIREGAHCYPPESSCSEVGLTDPITEYDHGLGSSVTGGFVYRGSAMPELAGQYIFGDFVTGRIWAVPADSPIGTAPLEIADTDHSIASFAAGVDGELYLIDYGGTSTIHQIVP
ncbi:glucose sorbosone dehydrogenase [Gammaproteobacteria bacterium]|nr:glucose sorbosone dehydrogenase [Gammaproteobacteria bacterium]